MNVPSEAERDKLIPLLETLPWRGSYPNKQRVIPSQVPYQIRDLLLNRVTLKIGEFIYSLTDHDWLTRKLPNGKIHKPRESNPINTLDAFTS